jgi:ribosomal protein S18 acetylase RimI-like enzyme
MPADLTLRPVKPDDTSLLLALFASSREKELARVEWDREQRRAFIQSQFQAQQHHYQKHFPHRDHHIVLFCGCPVGMTDIARSPREIRVLDIIIHPDRRNGGMGTGLMRDLMAEADRAGKQIGLYVEKHNPALRLYQRLGFTVTEDTGVHYGMTRHPVSAQTDTKRTNS